MNNSERKALITGLPLLPLEVKEHKADVSVLFSSDVLVRSGLYKIYDVWY